MQEATPPEHGTHATEHASEAQARLWSDCVYALLGDQLRELKEEAQHPKRDPRPLASPSGPSPRRQR